MSVPVVAIVLILLGLLLWRWSRHAIAAEAGKYMFIAGLLGLALRTAGDIWKIG